MSPDVPVAAWRSREPSRTRAFCQYTFPSTVGLSANVKLPFFSHGVDDDPGAFALPSWQAYTELRAAPDSDTRVPSVMVFVASAIDRPPVAAVACCPFTWPGVALSRMVDGS